MADSHPRPRSNIVARVNSGNFGTMLRRSWNSALIGCLFLCLTPPLIWAGVVSLGGQTAGATPFITTLSGTVAPAAALRSAQFTITPKPGSVTRPISATYSAAYLKSRGYLDAQTGAVAIPVFGLYPNFANTVTLRFVFTDNTVQQSSATVTAPAWGDPCGQFNRPTVMQARTGSTSLSYD